MKTLKLSLLAASVMLAGNALAVDNPRNDQDVDTIDVKGHVPARCNIQLAQPIVADFEHDVTKGNSRGGEFGIFCNSKSGAKMTLTSGGGLRLKGEDDPEHFVDYQAWWEAGGVALEVDTAGALSATDVLSGSKELAMGMVTTRFKMTLTEDAKFAGDYSDTITLAIEAN